MSALNTIANKLKQVDEESLQEVVETFAPPEGEDTPPLPSGALQSALQAMDVLPEPLRPQTDYIHVSALSEMCPRAMALAHKFGDSGLQVSPVGSGQRLIWSLGRAAEIHARQQLAEALPHMAFGDWSCQCGKTHHTSVYAEAKVKECPSCGGNLTIYNELGLVDEELKITGHPDFLLLRNGVEFTVVEFKSIKESGFDERKEKKEALSEHCIQVSHYRRTLKKMGAEVSGKSMVLYINKVFRWKDPPYLELDVLDEGGIKMGLDENERKAKVLQDWKKDEGYFPERLPLCESAVSPRAKKCGACTLCFSV